MLDQLPAHVGVGELYYVWRNGVEHDGLCACGERFSRCPFWTEVGERAFGGWDPSLARRVMQLQHRVDRSARIPILISPRRPTGFANALHEYAAVLRRLYAAILAVTGATVVVDSSKRPSLAYVLRQMPDIDLRVVQVVRDPRGVAFSFAKHVPLEPGVALGDEMPRSTTRKVSRRWVTVNGLVSGLGRLGVPVLRIRYEDLVDRPKEQLARVLMMQGFAGGPDVFDFVQEGQVSVSKTHVIAAGRIRLSSGTMPLRRDEAWRQDMPAASRGLVAALTVPTRWKYGYQ